MAKGKGGSRVGGFFRGVLVGLVVCAIGAVALSLSAPVPEREAIGVEPATPGGSAIEGMAPVGTAEQEAATAPASDAVAEPAGPATAPAVDVTVVPAGEPEATAGAVEGEVAPQATWPQGEPPAEGTPPAGESESTAPQAPTQ